MKPMTHCPSCKVPVEWILHDGLNSYDCSCEACPISFTERVRFPKDLPRPFELFSGTLISYSFGIGVYYIDMECSLDTMLIRNKSRNTRGPIVIQMFDIDWSDLSKLKSRIETIVNFS